MDRNTNLNDPTRTPPGSNLKTDQARFNSDLQIDPELHEGPASRGRIAMFAAAIVVVLGIVFYGLNNSARAPDGTSTTASQSTPAAAPTAPNTGAGTTTGAAPANPQQAKSAPTGTEVDRSKGVDNPPTK